MTEVREWIQRLESCFNEPNSTTESTLLDVLIGVLRRAELEHSGEAAARIEDLLIEAMNKFETKTAEASAAGARMLFSARMRLKRDIAKDIATKILEVLP